jgi:hypothetical protein
MYGEGISREGDLLDWPSSTRRSRRAAPGSPTAASARVRPQNVKQFLEHPETTRVIEERVRKELGLVREPEVAAV